MSTSLFIRFVSLKENISYILNSRCINLYITCHENDFPSGSVLYSDAVSDVDKL